MKKIVTLLVFISSLAGAMAPKKGTQRLMQKHYDAVFDYYHITPRPTSKKMFADNVFVDNAPLFLYHSKLFTKEKLKRHRACEPHIFRDWLKTSAYTLAGSVALWVTLSRCHYEAAQWVLKASIYAQMFIGLAYAVRAEGEHTVYRREARTYRMGHHLWCELLEQTRKASLQKHLNRFPHALPRIKTNLVCDGFLCLGKARTALTLTELETTIANAYINENELD